eukprot:COSAG02_NODE_1513_length_12207_cov_3.820240_5_plen_96_part_00
MSLTINLRTYTQSLTKQAKEFKNSLINCRSWEWNPVPETIRLAKKCSRKPIDQASVQIGRSANKKNIFDHHQSIDNPRGEQQWYPVCLESSSTSD